MSQRNNNCRYKDDTCLSCPEYEFCEVSRIEISYPYGLGFNAGFTEALKQKQAEIQKLYDENNELRKALALAQYERTNYLHENARLCELLKEQGC